MFSPNSCASDPAIRAPQEANYAREPVPTPPIPPPPPITPLASRLPPIFPTCYKQTCYFYNNADLGMQKFNLRVMALPDGRTRVQLHPLVLTDQKRELSGLCTRVFIPRKLDGTRLSLADDPRTVRLRHGDLGIFWGPGEPYIDLQLEPPIAYENGKLAILIRPVMPNEGVLIQTLDNFVQYALWKIQLLYKLDGGDVVNEFNPHHRKPTTQFGWYYLKDVFIDSMFRPIPHYAHPSESHVLMLQTQSRREDMSENREADGQIVKSVAMMVPTGGAKNY